MMHSQQNIKFPKDCCLLAHDREQITWHQIEKQLPEPSMLGDPQISKKKFSVFLGPNKGYQCFEEFSNGSCPEKS